jgi:hypothetical protein
MGLLFILQVSMSMEIHGGMIMTGRTPDLSTRALWQAYQQSSSSKAGGTGKGNDEVGLIKSLFILQSVL